MAYNANLLGPVVIAPAAQAFNSSKRPPGSSRELSSNPLNCLAARPPFTLIPICKNLKAGQWLAKQMGDYLDLLPKDQVVDFAKKKISNGASQLLQKAGASAILNKLKGWERGLEMACLIQPITLQNFFVTPTKFKMNPLGSQSEPTRLYAQMQSALSNQDVVKKLEQAEIKQYLKDLGKSVKLSPAESQVLSAFLTQLLEQSNSGFDAALVEIARQLGAKPFSNPQVGVCDVDLFYPLKNGPKNKCRRGRFLELGYVNPQGDLDSSTLDAARAGRRSASIPKPTISCSPTIWNSPTRPRGTAPPAAIVIHL